MKVCMFDVRGRVLWIFGVYKSQHDMTVRPAFLLTIWSCIMGTPREIWSRIVKTPHKRLVNEISSRVIDIIVFVYIALKSLLISICVIVPNPGASADILQHHGHNYPRLFPLKLKVKRT
jgi:hypothetical protein